VHLVKMIITKIITLDLLDQLINHRIEPRIKIIINLPLVMEELIICIKIHLVLKTRQPVQITNLPEAIGRHLVGKGIA
jgi:hypothetical protein